MTIKVFLTDDAIRDLRDIYGFILKTYGPRRADQVLSSIESRILQLENYPDRGSCPQELLDLGIKEYRQVYFKPYRISYRADEQKVVIYLITDGRRDMQTRLQWRLLAI